VALEAEARRLGTSQYVSFAGYRSDARRLMSAFDVYVNCSNYEGVSLTILEAMAAGLPVVATRVGGNAEVVSIAKPASSFLAGRRRRSRTRSGR